MGLFAIWQAIKRMLKCKNKCSLYARYNRVDGLDDDEMASNASSETLPIQSGFAESSTSDGEKLTSIESMLISQNEMLQRLLSASEPVASPTSISEDSYSPPPIENLVPNRSLPTSRCLEDIYQRTRLEAGFRDRHEWNAAYIHGMIRIDGNRSKSTTNNPTCQPCREAKFAICVGLMDDDPYKEFLCDRQKICCGWCEYRNTNDDESYRKEGEYLDTTNPLDELDRPRTRQEYLVETQSARLSQFFIDGEGLDPEVVTTEIPRYLGFESTVCPGLQYSPELSRTIAGYYITAQRPPTEAMLADLHADSAAWKMQREQKRLDKSSIIYLDEPYPGKQPLRYQGHYFHFNDTGEYPSE